MKRDKAILRYINLCICLTVIFSLHLGCATIQQQLGDTSQQADDTSAEKEAFPGCLS